MLPRRLAVLQRLQRRAGPHTTSGPAVSLLRRVRRRVDGGLPERHTDATRPARPTTAPRLSRTGGCHCGCPIDCGRHRYSTPPSQYFAPISDVAAVFPPVEAMAADSKQQRGTIVSYDNGRVHGDPASAAFPVREIGVAWGCSRPVTRLTRLRRSNTPNHPLSLGTPSPETCRKNQTFLLVLTSPRSGSSTLVKGLEERGSLLR